MTPWARFGDADQRLMGLEIRLAREWCVYAAGDPKLLNDLAEDTLGLLSLGRRRALLNAIETGAWETVRETVTLSDLLFLAGRYAERYSESPWGSPVDAAFRRAAELSDGESVRYLGPLPASLDGCGHPHLVRLAPYEEYERHLFPGEMAERAAEMKLYLAAALDRQALPAALMPAIAEAVAKRTFSSMRMSDERDWLSAIRAFDAIDEKAVGAALEARK
jgi:hypothetical protein